MRKTILISLSAALCLVLIIAGCKKELNVAKTENGSSMAKPDNDHGGCRLTKMEYYSAIDGSDAIDQFTYKNGLVDGWTTDYGWLVKMKYDEDGKMKGASEYDENNVLLYTTRFVYKHDKVIKEIWYVGNTNVVDDTVDNTYNQRGEMIRNESHNYDYYTVYTYEPSGQIASFLIYVGGALVIKGEHTSNRRYKNPWKSANGIGYAFAYTNSGIFNDDWWPSSEKWTVYDENGIPTVLYDQDPQKTVWHLGQQNYPEQVDYTDKLTGGHMYNTFTYENCGHGDNDQAEQSNQSNLGNKSRSSDNIRSILSGPRSEIKNKLAALRNKYFHNQ